MLSRTLLTLLIFAVAPVFANPYEMSGNVFAILNLPYDGSELQAEQNHRDLVETYKDDPLALKILDYAKTRVRLIRGWVFIGGTRVLPFESFTKSAYRSESDIIHIFRDILDEEHRQSYLYEALVSQKGNSAFYLAGLNLPELASAKRSSIFEPSGDLAFFSRSLANDLTTSLRRLTEDHGFSSGDLLFQVLKSALSKSRSQGLEDGDRGPLAGLLISVAGRMPIAEQDRFFEQLEAFIGWRVSLITLANSAPFIPYSDPERELLLQQIKNLLRQRGCSRFLRPKN